MLRSRDFLLLFRTFGLFRPLPLFLVDEDWKSDVFLRAKIQPSRRSLFSHSSERFDPIKILICLLWVYAFLEAVFLQSSAELSLLPASWENLQLSISVPLGGSFLQFSELPKSWGATWSLSIRRYICSLVAFSNICTRFRVKMRRVNESRAWLSEAQFGVGSLSGCRNQRGNTCRKVENETGEWNQSENESWEQPRTVENSRESWEKVEKVSEQFSQRWEWKLKTKVEKKVEKLRKSWEKLRTVENESWQQKLRMLRSYDIQTPKDW